MEKDLYGFDIKPTPWWRFLSARLFGKKHVGCDLAYGIETTVEGYWYKGDLFITKTTHREVKQ